MLRSRPLLALAAFASTGAGVVHLAVAPEHRDWWASVAFFAALGAFQIGWATLVLFRPIAPRIVFLGAIVNVAALMTWVISRTSGIPFGPKQGVAESMARADVLASVLGAVVVVASLAVTRGWGLPARRTRRRSLVVTGAGGVLVSAMSIVALTGVSGHGHADGHGGVEGGLSPAALSAEIAPSEVVAAAKKCAKQVGVAATAANRAKADPSARTEAAARRQQQRLRAACDPKAASSTPTAAKPPVVAEAPHGDDGH
ncbi:MAG: hypothetical protein ACT4P1_11030 [Sporichthyaceae bacterium]